MRRTLQANTEQEKLPVTHAAVRTAPAIEGLANYEETGEVASVTINRPIRKPPAMYSTSSRVRFRA